MNQKLSTPHWSELGYRGYTEIELKGMTEKGNRVSRLARKLQQALNQ